MQIRDVFNWALDQNAWWLFAYWIVFGILTLIITIDKVTR